MRNTIRILLLIVVLMSVNEYFTHSAYAQPKCIGRVATIVGTPNDDVIDGTTGPDVIQGLAGNDTINGRGGNDMICGGIGRDIINGGVGNDSIFGGPARDILRGNAGDDDLHDGGGNDVLNGGPGFDECLDEIGINTFLACDATCQSVTLNSDFSDRGYFFIDTANSVLIGLTSNGNDVAVVLSDASGTGAKIGGVVFNVTEDGCNIASGTLDMDMDGSFTDEKILPASGTCQLVSNRTEFVLQDLTINHIPLGADLKAICGSFDPLTSSSDSVTGKNKNDDMLDALSAAIPSVQERLEGNQSLGLIEEFAEKLSQ